MSLEYSPARQGDFARPVYSVAEFCKAHHVCRSKLYVLWAAGKGPRFFKIGARTLISRDAAAEWLRGLETGAV
jgi:hypothetical protein